ncbi:MAG: hypothetical protein M0P13_00975 [Fibrobacteraceae bacterium]|nr:hypothetical protein [Fibrobacteraceae bacterium]
MSDQRVYLDDIYASQKCGGSIFRAIVMMAHEARFINEQARLGYLQLTKKPTTIAMYKFKENKLTMMSKEEAAAQEAAKATETNSATVENSSNSSDAANDAFGA